MLGRNGVGKTTLLATIMGHTTMRAGSIRFAGEEISGLPPYRRARLGVGFVPQEREIFRSLTVEENLEVAQRPGRWTLARVYDFFPPCITAGATAAISSPAASSRCWRSAAR